METGDHTLVKHLKTDPANAPLEAEDKAMLDFALKLTCAPSSVRQEEVESLRQRGFSEEQAVDIVLITCTFNFMHRLAVRARSGTRSAYATAG
jgi:alkylhydroperoxidase family enzyme